MSNGYIDDLLSKLRAGLELSTKEASQLKEAVMVRMKSVEEYLVATGQTAEQLLTQIEQQLKPFATEVKERLDDALKHGEAYIKLVEDAIKHPPE